MTRPNFEAFAARFCCDGVKAIALMGSFARGEPGLFSDIDIVRFCTNDEQQQREPETHLVDDRFVMVSDACPSQVEKWFEDPKEAVAFIEGLRSARPLWDPDGCFAEIQARARAFVWSHTIQEMADAYASSQMVGWIEEVHKGLEGLRVGDEGRMLNARYGLSWGLTNVMCVQRGVLITGDNAFYPETVAAIGEKTDWAFLSRRAFGIEAGISLSDQVTAGLRLYVLTAELLADVLMTEDKTLVQESVNRIRRELR